MFVPRVAAGLTMDLPWAARQKLQPGALAMLGAFGWQP
jgi:hypothetical protein